MVNNDKEVQLRDWIKKNPVDMIGVQEANVNWSLCDQREKSLYRFKCINWNMVRGSSSHNKNEKKVQFNLVVPSQSLLMK